MQGDELCRKVRMNVETRGIPILILTSEEGARQRARGSGQRPADDYVSKSPPVPNSLLRVRALLRNSGAQSSILSPQDAYFRRARLLAIDDSPTYLECLADAFTSEGYELTRAGSAERGAGPDCGWIFRLRDGRTWSCPEWMESRLSPHQ